MQIIFGFLILIIFTLLFYFSCLLNERKLFNNGICSQCNIKFKYIAYDSSGSTGYECPNCHHSVWISCHSVDKDFDLDNSIKFIKEEE